MHNVNTLCTIDCELLSPVTGLWSLVGMETMEGVFVAGIVLMLLSEWIDVDDGVSIRITFNGGRVCLSKEWELNSREVGMVLERGDESLEFCIEMVDCLLSIVSDKCSVSTLGLERLCSVIEVLWWLKDFERDCEEIVSCEDGSKGSVNDKKNIILNHKRVIITSIQVWWLFIEARVNFLKTCFTS